MPNTSKRRLEFAFADSAIVDVSVPRGMLEDMFTLIVPYTANVTTGATSVRTRGAPIKTIQFIGDGNETLHSIKVQDAIRKAEIYAKLGLASMIASPSGTAIGNYAATARVPIFFGQRWAQQSVLTALATWRLAANPIIRVTCGSHADVYVGGVGNVTVAAGAPHVLIEGIDGYDLGSLTPEQFGDALGISVDRYKEAQYVAANPALNVNVEPTADIRGFLITGEDNNGEPLSDAELAKIALDFVENTNVRIHQGVNLAALRASNAQAFRMPNGLPPGCCVLDFAEDEDILDIYPATRKNAIDFYFNVAVPASGTYTLRVHVMAIKAGRGAQAAVAAAGH